MAHVDNLEHDGRWPLFGPRCVAEAGVHSVLAVRLTLGGRDRAALNLYASERLTSTEAFDLLRAASNT